MSLQEKLHALFLLDQQVRGLRSRVDNTAGRLKAQEALLTQYTQQRNELAEQLKQTQAAANSLEHEARGLEEKTNRLREQMNSVKSNKEYSALLLEVNTLKVERSKLEDEALSQLSRVDQLKTELDAMDAKVGDQEKILSGAQRDLDEANAEIADRLQAVTAERDTALQQIPLEARQIFTRTADIHEGETMAEVVEENRRHMEYSCGGCYISIPIERVSTLMSKPDEIVCCPNCSRILYISSELKSSLTRA